MTFNTPLDERLQRRARALNQALEQIDLNDSLSTNFAKIRLFGSNHFRRWEELDHLNAINSPTSTSNEAPFRFETFQPDRPKSAVFIGDSHAEFGCRLPLEEPEGCDYSTYNYWLGPVTMMGVLTNTSLFEEIASAISKTNELHSVATKRSVIFSFGEIDVRHVIYQFIIRQKFGSVDDYVTFLRPLLHTFFGKLTSRFPHNTFFMLQPIPTSNLKPYSSPTNVPAMTAYYEEIGDHPSLGSPEVRQGFWRRIDGMTSEVCDEQSVHYLPLPSFYFDDGYLNPKHTADNTHVSSRGALTEQEFLHERVLFPA